MATTSETAHLEAALWRVILLLAAALCVLGAARFWPASLGGSTSVVRDGPDLMVVRTVEPQRGETVMFAPPGGADAVVGEVRGRLLDGDLAIASPAGDTVAVPVTAVLGVVEWRIPDGSDWLTVLGSPIVLVVLVGASVALVIMVAVRRDRERANREVQIARVQAVARQGTLVQRH